MSVREYIWDCYTRLSIVYTVEIISASMGATQVQDNNNIRFFIYREAIALKHNTLVTGSLAS